MKLAMVMKLAKASMGRQFLLRAGGVRLALAQADSICERIFNRIPS
jgi:hypothetical protein